MQLALTHTLPGSACAENGFLLCAIVYEAEVAINENYLAKSQIVKTLLTMTVLENDLMN